MSFYSVQLVHEKKKSLKEHKLNELRLLKQQPLVLTEEVLEKKISTAFNFQIFKKYFK